MNNFVPYEKLSKKAQRKLDREKRGSWGEINPVTRKPEKPGAYSREKEVRRWKTEESGRSGGFLHIYTNRCERKICVL